MARENTNKHYSLRKLKKGTASVAVALTVLGAGLITENTVLAQEQGYNLAQTSDRYLDKLFEKVSEFQSF